MSDLFDLPFEERARASARAGSHRARRLSSTRRRRATADSSVAPQPRRPAAACSSPSSDACFSVTELTVRVRDLLEAEFFEVWVEGELSNCRVWNTGHLYFTLKDGASQIKAVIFRSALRYLKFKPADGLRVVARGRVSVYEPKGEYQLVCEHLEPHGLGALQLAFEQLKKRLQAEGLFDAARKRPLPSLPRKIGIVTSLDGAAIRDIIKVLRRRYANAHLVICPARVQGEDAAPEIARALRQIARVPGVDVVIVGRGGGSIEDLWAFNEEVVARAIARVPVPVISAVGHETDVTIADFVADVRAPTPSAAAELVVSAEGRVLRPDRSPARSRCARRRGRASSGSSRRVHIARRAGRRSPDFPAGSRCAAGTPRSCRTRSRGSCAPALATRERRRQQLERQLDDASISAAGSRASARGWSASTAGCAARCGGGSIAPSRSWAPSPAGSTRSARWRSSAAATRWRGTPTGRACCATPRTSRLATRCA